MNIQRNAHKVQAELWNRYRYNITSPVGENGCAVTGCPAHIALSRQAASEGIVLLENDGTLPLASGTRVALFGVASLDYVKGGGGSGQVYSAYIRNLYEGLLENGKVSVYEPLTRWYYDYCTAHLSEYEGDALFPELALPDEIADDAAAHADVAIISIHRFSGEGFDRSEEPGDFTLTAEEEALVKQVTARFERVIAVLNVGGMVDLSWIRENPRITAAVMAWQGGMDGASALADILCGDVNPSGRLTDTFARSLMDYPSAGTYNESEHYVEYYEDIYVGYRYFETIPGVADRVVYPFGYGLSYTTFAFSDIAGEQEGENIRLTVTVTNTGDVAGKQVVQAYYSAPQGALGRPTVELAAFAKTALLQPGESERVILTFPITDMATYDDVGKLHASAWLLEGGDYRFYIGENCRQRQEVPYHYTVSETFVVTEQLAPHCVPVDINRRLKADGTYEPLPTGKVPPFPPSKKDAFTPPSELYTLADVVEGKVDMETYVAQLTDEELIAIAGGNPNRGVAITFGMGGIERLGMPAFMTADGPAGVRINGVTGIAATAWPCATLLACTWNTDLMEKIGRAGALECRENAMAIWLTPALNIHRNPLCGRNFEYFSEDPLISGHFAAAKVRGIQSVQISACIKHFACNNKEGNRLFSDSRLSERALREIYLKGFEICIKEAKPWMVMASYNIVNGQRACESHELLTKILRDEWGFDGAVTSDWGGPCYHANLVKAGCDIRMHAGQHDVLFHALGNFELSRADLQACAVRLLNALIRIR